MGLATVPVSVNFSRVDLFDPQLRETLLRIMRKEKVRPDMLGIEVTESAFIEDSAHISEILQKMRRAGFTLFMDDFGTGYSSLSYLGRLPVDRIKIDQSFVRGLPEDTHATAIVRAVLMLAESLDKNVVAEGIETQDQAWLLRLAGCRTGQGYFFGRPGPAEVMVARLLAREADRMAMDKTG